MKNLVKNLVVGRDHGYSGFTWQTDMPRNFRYQHGIGRVGTFDRLHFTGLASLFKSASQQVG